MGILGNFSFDDLPPISGILGGLNNGIEQNRMALIGMGLGLMGGGGSQASMKAAIEGLTSGSRSDYLRLHEENAKIQKEREYARQIAMAKALGLPDIFAGSSVVDKVAADRYLPKEAGTPREVSFTERQFNMLKPEEQDAYRKRTFLGEKGADAEWEPFTHKSGGVERTLFRNKKGDILSKPPGADFGEEATTGPVLTAQQKTDLSKAETAAQNLFQAVDKHSEHVSAFGAGGGIFPGGEKQTLGGSYADLKVKLKEASELGALTTPDLPILDAMIPNPLVNNPLELGNTIKLQERTQAAETQIKERAVRELNNKRKALGLPPKRVEDFEPVQGSRSNPQSAFDADPFAGVTIRQR